MTEYRFPIHILRVIDGDTMEVTIDLHFGISITRKIRLYGIDCPETRSLDQEEKRHGLAAKEEVIRIVNNAIKIEIGVHATRYEDRYGRIISNLYCLDADNKWINVNKKLVEDCLAVKYNGGNRADLKIEHMRNRSFLFA